MDEHHQQLVDIINDFINHDDMEYIPNIIKKIFKYIELHFKAEEQLMLACGFPDLASHKEQRTQLLNKAKRVSATIKTYDEKLHQKVADFLVSWLTNHILQSDMEYKPYALEYKKLRLKGNNLSDQLSSPCGYKKT